MRRDLYRPLVSFSPRAAGLCGLLIYGLLAGSLATAQDEQDQGAQRFAPGVLTTIAPEVNREDLLQVHDIIELRANAKLERAPNSTTKSRTLYEIAKDVGFRHDVWCLELAFKPLRMLHVDIPQPSGKMRRKLIWYLVYRVRNTGAGLSPQEQEDGTFTTIEKPADQLRFVPQFVLTSQDRDRAGGRVRKSYLDRIIPAALPAIQRREFPGGKLLNSVEISEQLLKLETGRATSGLWGVATWEDVDPQIDFFSVFVGGLNNAYEWQDSPDQYQLGDPPGKGRKFQRKLLQLNFWRPGDTLAENEREIRYGAAPGAGENYGTSEGVAYRWIYR
ncbi:MAG: hypothetical protein GXP26_03010 [Planctomycetes bacterium]|nr:hypothetical protein [Planctomycetota bacterium]